MFRVCTEEAFLCLFDVPGTIVMGHAVTCGTAQLRIEGGERGRGWRGRGRGWRGRGWRGRGRGWRGRGRGRRNSPIIRVVPDVRREEGWRGCDG